MADLNNTIVRGKLRVTEDINANGNITGNGSGLTNLNASNISSGTLSVDRMDTSGAKAGSYGPSENATPAYGAKFNVPYITIDNKGRVTAASTKTVTIPASDNTDTHYTNYLQIKGDGAEAVKFEQSADKTLNLKPSGSVSISAASGEITISATDTKNTAGATDSEEKLYLVGAKDQTANPQTFSNSSIYMGAAGTLTASALSTNTIELPSSCLGLKFIDGDNMYSAADFNYSSIGGAYLNMDGHLLLNEAGGHPNKPDNKTGLTSVGYADYFDTGITVCGTASGSGQWYKLSFPGKSGTFLLDSDLVELTLTNNGNKRFIIGSGLSDSWSDIGTNGKVYTQSGYIYADAFYAASDRRLKENIKDLDLNCLDLVNNINLREFSWKTDEEHKPVIGAIAQELRQVLPEKYVHEFIGGQETDDEYLSINDSKLVYLLIGAIQEQQKEIESLKAKIDGKIV